MILKNILPTLIITYMIILGLNSCFHDSTAFIVVDGKLVAAIEKGGLLC